MYKDTVTLFNRKEGEDGDTWYPTVLHGVHLNMDRAAILAKYGAESADNAMLNIRYKQEGAEKVVQGKMWKPPKVWEQLPDPKNAITLTPGTRFDFFWLGDWGSEEPVRDADYISDADFYTYMNRVHDYVFAITSVGGPYSVIPHFEVMGK